MNYDWNDLRYFLALAEHQNLAAAGESAKASPVTVMRRVKNLEDRLGSNLFVRRRDGHNLTSSGKQLLNIAREVRANLAAVPEAVAGRNAKAHGAIKIRTTEIAANEILLPALPAFLKRHPDVDFEIDASPNVADLLTSDAGISLRFARPDSGDFKITNLGRVQFSVWGTQQSASDSAIAWTGDFEGISIDRHIRGLNYRSVLGLSTFAGHLAACRAGLGRAVLPDFVASKYPELRLVEPAVDLNAWLVVPEQQHKLRRIQLACKFVREAYHNATKPKN